MNNLKRLKSQMFDDGGGKPPPSVKIKAQARCRPKLSQASMLLTFMILSIFLQSQDLYASAKLNFNILKGGTFYPDPMTVNADSVLEIEGLTSSKFASYAAGDCFQIEFEPIEDYIDDNGVNNYEPFLDQPFAECSFTPASTCSRVNGFVAQIKLDEGGNDLIGKFGKMRNPYSTVPLVLSKIRYYPACVTVTQADATSRSKELQFSPGRIGDGSVTVTQQIVGEQSSENIASFTFTPASAISPFGGAIEIKAPAWYGTSVLNTPLQYPFEGDCKCTASFIDQGLDQGISASYDINQQAFVKSYKIFYTTIKASFSTTDPVTIQCQNWRNPVTPEVASGFSIQTQDVNEYLIDVTDSFNLDASSFAPFELPSNVILYTLSTSTVQQQSKLKFSFETPVPLEYDAVNGGCFFKFEFPDELVINDSLLTSYQVENYMLQQNGDAAALPIADVSTLVGDAQGKKYVVMKGCFQPVDEQVTQQFGAITFNSVINPYAKRDTEKFLLTVFKEYDPATKTLSKPIIQSTQSIIPATIFDTNQVESIVLTASNMIVQEKGTHTFEFTIKSILPGTQNGANAAEQISPAIHILFPPTFQFDTDNQATDAVTLTGVTPAGAPISISSVNFFNDSTATYQSDCQLEEIICFRIEWEMTFDIEAGSRLTITTQNLKNPESVLKVGNIIVSTMMKYQQDSQFYKIDTSSQDPNFRAFKGDLDETLMTSSSPPAIADFSTNAPNVQYLIEFQTTHKVPRDGWVKLILPPAFEMTSESTAVAMFQVSDDAGVNYASVNSVSKDDKMILGQATIDLAAGTKYKIRIGGLRNPRYLIDNDLLPENEKQKFTVKTYGRLPSNSASPVPNDIDNLIDIGSGAGVKINVLSEIPSFSIEGYDTTNGVSTKYMITWFTETDTENDDYIAITLPIELQAVTKSEAHSELICSGKNGIVLVECQQDLSNPQLLIITLKEVKQKTGLFKIELENIKNAPSLRGSSPFAPIIQKTVRNQDVSQYSGQTKPIVTINDYASDLLYLGSDNITQSSKEYSEEAQYGISFEPFSKMVDPDADALTILLAYPNTISPISASGCTVRAAKNLDGSDYRESDPTNCNQITGSRLFKIEKAIPFGFDGNITIYIKFKNPKDNWGEIGFKIKTYEIVEGATPDDDTEQFLVDMLEGNELIPNLKCTAPCKECKEDDNKVVLDMEYCTECWQDNPKKYLYEKSPYSPDGSGESTCNDSCPDGFTSNGDKDYHICVPCDRSCATCADEGELGDRNKCITCHPGDFIYSIESKCFEECGMGFYQVSDDACDKCDDRCANCEGDRFNCIQCDPEGTNPALFTSSMITKVDGKNIEVERSTCRSQCPAGYYMDRSIPFDFRCKPCESPCSTCEGAKDACLTCDGTDNLYYVYKHDCYEECPDSTAPDMSSLECIDCGPNCLKCGLQDEASCFECIKPFLLENGECVVTCQQMGNYPNLEKTQCVNEKQFPVIGPIFSIGAIITVAIGFIAKRLKRESQMIPFIIAFCGIIEWMAIVFQMYLCSFYNEWKYFGFCALAFIILMTLNLANYLYIQNNVVATDAEKKVRLSQKKVDELKKEKKKKDLRDKKYQARVAEAQKNLPSKKKADESNVGNEGGEIELRRFYDTSSSDEQYDGGYDLDNLSDSGSGNSQKEGGSESDYSSDSETYEDMVQFEGGCFGGKKKLTKEELEDAEREQKMLTDMGLIKEVNYLGFATYYQIKSIKDKGYIKWADAFEETAKYIKYISFINFKFYRMTYSFFMGRKQFLCLYQKKKYKKFMVTATLVSMFFVELMMIICDIVGALNLKIDTQIFYTFCDTFVLCCFMLVIQFIEIARLDKIMKTVNTSGHRANKSAAACISSDDSDAISSDGDSDQDDYPDWRIMLKHVEGNQNLFHKTPLQRHLNNLEKKYDPKLRVAESCVDTSENPWQDYFNTGTEKEEDPRLTRSFPTTPKKYKEFDGPFPELRPLDATSDNCGFEAKEPGKKGGATYSEMGTQAMPSEILSALQRKGGDLLTPGLEKDDYLRKRTTKKKRGRKNKYYRQIDAEDDEEADQMSDGSDDDGLDGIKEEDDEDEDERKAKLAKIKAEKERLAKEQAARDEAERKKKEAAEQARLEAERKAAEEEAKRQKKLAEEEEKKRMQEQNAKEAADALNALRNKQASEAPKVASEVDNASDMSKAMIKSTALQNFGDRPDEQIIEAPPKVGSRRFNECDIIGNYDRDDKGNVMVGEPDKNGKYFDKDGKETNERGYLIDAQGNIINNYNGKKMFNKKELDEKGEVPAPFNVEKHNFNPHEVRGHFDYDKNGNPIIKKDGKGGFVDKRGHAVSGRGYLIDKEGNVIDHAGRKKFHKSHVTSEGDLPKLFNYGGRRFDVNDTIGQLDKDANGQIIPLTDQQGKLTDNLGRPINSKGYLIDELGNIIDKDGRQIFEKKHLMDDEYPKIMPFSKFNVKNVLGDFEMDPLGQPILEKEGDGEFKDRAGQKVNSKGYMIDRDGNIINKDKKIMFPKQLLDNEQDIPKVFRTGLLKSDTASSLSRLMSEIGKNQPSEFDQEEMRIQEEIARNYAQKGQNRPNSGNTSVDSMMEDTPANYNYQNQRFDADMEGDEDMDGDMDQQDEEDDDEYGSQYDQMGKTGFTNQDGVQELAKKRRKKKKKKKKRKPVEFEDPSLREHLLAGAYGGIAKRKPKRQGVKYTTDINAGLRDIATPASAFMRDPSKKMMTSFSGFQDVAGHARDSSRHHRGQRVASSKGRSEIGSQLGSRMRGGRPGESTSKLLDPQQREMQLKQEQMDEIAAKRAAKIAAKKKRIAGGKPGKISQDADFEKMFGKDIDEFLEDSEWDIESIDKMSQFSRGSKGTIRSAAQAGKLRGLEKLYLQRIENGMNPNAKAQQPGKSASRPGKFRDEDSPQRKQAWETGSRVSKGGKR